MERRQYPRIPLDAPYFTELLFTDQSSIKVMVVDFSPGGIQVALPPNTEETSNLLGQHVYVQHLPGEHSGQDAIIAWISRHHCGIRFTNPLPLEVEDLLSITGSL